MFRLWRRVAAIPLALVLLVALTSPSVAWERLGGVGYRYLDDRILDGTLSVCLGHSSTDFAYVNRYVINLGLNEMASSLDLSINSIGSCIGDQEWYSNVIVHSNDPSGVNCFTVNAAWTGWSPVAPYSQIHLYFNVDCNWHVNSSNNVDVPSGKLDLYSFAAHEMGHALGLDHSGDNRAVMDDGGPDAGVTDCNNFSGRRLRTQSNDDRSGLTIIYPGLAISGSWPVATDCWL